MTGRIHSFQSLGTVDGPGDRFVAFFQGCNLRCRCCHNPDTWDCAGGTEYTAGEIVRRASRYQEYFGNDGGITLSGGEPLLQADFAREIFAGCHEAGIHTCLDTSGDILSDAVKALLFETDRVLLDIKYVSDEGYRENVGCSIETPLAFLAYLNEQAIPTTLRQVIIPGLNDSPDDVLFLRTLAEEHRCVDKIELLPFRKLCQVKYDSMGIPFPLAETPEPSPERMSELRALIGEYV